MTKRRLLQPWVQVVTTSFVAVGAGCFNPPEPTRKTPPSASATPPATSAPVATTSANSDSANRAAKLPTWDEVNPPADPSKPVTNPPSPMLLLSNDGRCFAAYYREKFGPPEFPPTTLGNRSFHVVIRDSAPGERQIECPEGAAAHLAAQRGRNAK